MPLVRPAVPADVAALVALRRLMFDEMGYESLATEWDETAAAWFTHRLTTPDNYWDVVRILVSEEGDGTVAAAGMIQAMLRAPSPTNPTGELAHISNIATLPAYRRRGHARAVVAGLVAWADERHLPVIELRATPIGRPLYEKLGFTEHPPANPTLRRQL